MALTCLTCRVTFSTNEHQKEHYKSEWHRYNLTRKMVEMEPVTYEFFLQVQKSREAESGAQVPQHLIYTCNLCRKTFNSQPMLQQHFQSRKHREELQKRNLQQPGVTGDAVGKATFNPSLAVESQQATTIIQEISSVRNKQQRSQFERELPLSDVDKKTKVTGSTGTESETDETEEQEELDIEIDLNECLFCPIQSNSLEQNLKHMSIEHSFFVNDLQYCVDLEGLIAYLASKIRIGLRCIYCSDAKRAYQSLDSVQQHMISKGHCKMKSELGEILEWAPFYDYSITYPDADGDHDKDEEFDVNEALQRSDWELILPSGAVIGHRSLQRFYRQKYNPRSLEMADRAHNSPEHQRRLCKIMTDYRAVGWKQDGVGTLGPVSNALAVKKARDMKFFYRLKQQHDFMRTGKVKNIASQPHFRAQMLK